MIAYPRWLNLYSAEGEIVPSSVGPNGKGAGMTYVIDARRIISALIWLSGALALPAFGQGTNSTVTTSESSQTGAINAIYVVLEDTVGPGTILTGTLSGCTLVPPPSAASCGPTGGSGTPSDPYLCPSTPPGAPPGTSRVFAGCSGQTFTVIAGSTNLNVHTHTVTAVAPVVTAAAVPLSPWVPAGSAVGAVLLAMLLLRRSIRG